MGLSKKELKLGIVTATTSASLFALSKIRAYVTNPNKVTQITCFGLCPNTARKDLTYQIATLGYCLSTLPMIYFINPTNFKTFVKWGNLQTSANSNIAKLLMVKTTAKWNKMFLESSFSMAIGTFLFIYFQAIHG